MSLASLYKRKQVNVLGINSGTSADGLDLAVIKVTRTGKTTRYAFVQGTCKSFPESLRDEILQIASAESVNPERLIELDQALGIQIGKAATAFIRRLHKAGYKVDLIGSHGQTVRHTPQFRNASGHEVRGTLQLGNLSQIASLALKPVVGDFRQADVAAGNEGAPITTEAIARLFRHQSDHRLIINIGGIANYFWLPSLKSREAIAAADCGPGNSLSDILSRRLFSQPYDNGGKHAQAGKPSMRLLSLLHAHPFFLGKSKSTGREDFGEEMAEKMVAFGREKKMSPQDLLASAAELTACAVASTVSPLVNSHYSGTSLYLTGGGGKNRFMVRRIKELLPNLPVRSISELGFDPTQVEAVSYAALAECCLRGEAIPGSDPKNKFWPVMGSIVQPPQVRAK